MERVPTVKLAASAAASWAWGTGLIVGMEIAQTRGVGAWLIWAACNSLTLALFGFLMHKKVLNRTVMNSKPFKAFAIMIQIFCLLFQMTVINTVLGRLGIPAIASYAIASTVGIIFTLWMYKRGLPTSIKTDVVQWLVAIGGMLAILLVGLLTGAPAVQRASSGMPDVLWGIWSGCVLLSGPIGDLQHWQRGELPGGPAAYKVSALFFAGFLLLDFLLSGLQFNPIMNGILIVVLLSVTSSTIDSIAVALHELGGKKIGTAVSLTVCVAWGALASFGVLSLWSYLGIPRVVFALAIVAGGIWLLVKRRKKMEKLKLKKVKVADLVPAERNCRKHSQVQIAELVRSLKEFGQTRPFVIDEGNVVLVGNGMLAAMQSAGIDTAEAYVVSGWAESKKRKLILADNKCYELGSTDIDVIFEELKSLGLAGDFDIPGFDSVAIQRLCDSVCDDALNTMSARGVGSSYDAPVSKFSAEPVLASRKPESEPASFVEEMPVASPVYVRSPGEESPSSIICPYCGKVFNSGAPK